MPLRADAVRNRVALLEAARRCFARDGADAQMEAIAAAAGVGIGTLYRHFRNKTELITVLLDEQLRRLIDVASDRATPSAFQRFANLLTELLKAQSCDRTISELASCSDEAQRSIMDPMIERIRTVMTALMNDAVAAGELRDDVTADDVLRIVINPSLSTAANAWDGYARVVLDGLRARPKRRRA